MLRLECQRKTDTPQVSIVGKRSVHRRRRGGAERGGGKRVGGERRGGERGTSTPKTERSFRPEFSAPPHRPAQLSGAPAGPSLPRRPDLQTAASLPSVSDKQDDERVTWSNSSWICGSLYGVSAEIQSLRSAAATGRPAHTHDLL